VLLLLCCKNC